MLKQRPRAPWDGLGGTGADADERDLYYTYRLLLGREPDAEGWAVYGPRLELGLEELMRSFLTSTEFQNRTAALTRPLEESAHRLARVHGFRMWASPEDASGPGQAIALRQEWEGEIALELERRLPAGGTFVDVGANIGYYSLLAASRGCRVIAFEPNPYCYGLLLASAKVNGFEIDMRPFALAQAPRVLALDSYGSNGNVTAFSGDLGEALTRRLVWASTLDHELAHLDRLDVLKLDVEGAEHQVLEGGTEVLRKFRPVIFTELLPPLLRDVSGVDSRTYLDLLSELGYRMAAFVGGSLRNETSDVDALLELCEQSPSGYLDLVATPT